MATLGTLFLPKLPSDGWKSESTLEQASGLEIATCGFAIQCKYDPTVGYIQVQFKGLEYLRLKVLAII